MDTQNNQLQPSEEALRGSIPMDMNSLLFALSSFTYYFASIDGRKKLLEKEPSMCILHTVDEIKISREEFNKENAEASELEASEVPQETESEQI